MSVSLILHRHYGESVQGSDFCRVLLCEKLEINVIDSSSVHNMEPEAETEKGRKQHIFHCHET
jgi:hypothetical protein